MLHLVTELWNHVEHLGRQYHVNPMVFGTLYLAHHPLFWGTVALLAVRVRTQRPVALYVACAVVFWTMPYAYVLLFGRGLPFWAYGVAAVILVVGGRHAIGEIRSRLRPSAPPA